MREFRALPLAFFKRTNLFNAFGVSAVGAAGGEEDFDDRAHLLVTDQVGRHAQHVAVILLSADPCRHIIVRQRSAHAGNFVGDDRHADSRSVDQHADFAFAIRHRARSGHGEVGVVANLRAIAAEIDRFVAGGLEQRDDQRSFDRKASVITGYGYLQLRSFVGCAHPTEITKLDRSAAR